MFDKEVVGAILPSSNFDAFTALMHGPFRALLKTSILTLETLLSSTFALTTQPENTPLILLNALQERIQDPFVVFNSLVKATVQSMNPTGGLV